MEEDLIRNNKKTMIVSIVILALVVGVFLYYLYREGKQTSFKDTEGKPENSQRSESTVTPSANPLLLTIPESTPVEKTNPFKYENPFE